MEILGNINTIYWIIGMIISFFVGVAAAIAYIRSFFKRERIISNNLKRPIKIFYPSGNAMDNMDMEFKLLAKSGLFNVEKPTNDSRDTVNITNHSLVILGCDKKMGNFDDVFNKVQQEKIPVLLYTFGDNEALKPEHWLKLKQYPYYSVCNSPLRLGSDVFTVLSTFPNNKR